MNTSLYIYFIFYLFFEKFYIFCHIIFYFSYTIFFHIRIYRMCLFLAWDIIAYFNFSQKFNFIVFYRLITV